MLLHNRNSPKLILKVLLLTGAITLLFSCGGQTVNAPTNQTPPDQPFVSRRELPPAPDPGLDPNSGVGSIGPENDHENRNESETGSQPPSVGNGPGNGSSGPISVAPVIRPTFYCQPDSNRQFNEKIQMESGSKPEFDFALGGGCITKPIREVWASSLNWAALQWDGVHSSDFQKRAPKPGVNLFYYLHYHVDYSMVFISIPVDWYMEWYHTLQRGTVSAPEKVMINFEKVDGTSYIKRWKGTIVLEKVTDQVTSYDLSAELKATQRGVSDVEHEVSEIHQKLKTGAPNWEALPTR